MRETVETAMQAAPRRSEVRRLRRARQAGSWLLLAGWIVLPLLPVLAFALSKSLGLEF